MKHFVIAVSGFLLLIFVAGCTSGNEKTTIQLAEVTRSLFYAPQYVAIEQGFFEEQGIDIGLQTTY